MRGWLEGAVAWLVATVGAMGYPGVVALMFLESSFFPFPSEVVIPPAGYLASRGEMHLGLVIAAGVLGSLLGALFNYGVAVWLGRPFLLRWGRYVGLTPRALERVEDYFRRHGEISTFVGRLVPGVRQYISFPAGLARMRLAPFCLYTVLGAGIWVAILAWIGYFVGNNQEKVVEYVHRAFWYLLPALVALCGIYVWRHRARTPNG
ncbi:DedA family protein [Deferrisoma palaeochoriense]